MDHFSMLSSEIVVTIITFLPFLDAFRLCLLKKEWHHQRLWKYCGSIEMSETFYNEALMRNIQFHASNLPYESTSLAMPSFVNFFNRVVTQISSPSLSKFSFGTTYKEEYHSLIDEWIRVAISKDVQVLDLDFLDGESSIREHNLFQPQNTIPFLWFGVDYMIPHILSQIQYTTPTILNDGGRSIRILSLRSCFLSGLNYNSFISLTNLTLSHIWISTAEIASILAGCTNLESLTLEKCYQLMKLEIMVPCIRLRRLVVRYCEPMLIEVEMDCRTLQHFEYKGDLINFVLSNLDGLEEVVLDFRWDFRFLYRSSDVMRILNSFSRSRILTVCISAFQVFPHEYMFGELHFLHMNVEHLTTITCMEPYEMPMLLGLLCHATRLKTLRIKISLPNLRNNIAYCQHHHRHTLPIGFWDSHGLDFPSLETVEVDGLRGQECEDNFLRFLLTNARNLQEVIIKQGEMASSSFLLNMKPASKCVKIVFR
ncbi:hypothetical protein NMG60_11003101 [Bertholletia excelsa]